MKPRVQSVKKPTSMAKKYNVCLIGSGAVGTIASIVLEKSNRAQVTAVLRSKYEIVKENGWDVKSVDHGVLKGWRPSRIEPTILDAASTVATDPYDYVLVSTKALPDLSSIAELIAPLITPGVTAIVLFQNGLYIERPVIAAFPSNTCISSISIIGSRIEAPNIVVQIGPEIITIGAHFHAGLSHVTQLDATKKFVDMYTQGGAHAVTLTDNMPLARWKKLIWNGTFNTLCALMRMDVGELQSSKGREALLLPMMEEIREVAIADGCDIGRDNVMTQAYRLPNNCRYKPSMLLDLENGRPMELEVILGAPIRRAKELDIQVPILETVYELLKLEKWKIAQKCSA